MKILIVDDSSTMRRMIIASLQDLPGVIFAEASNGMAAFEQIAIWHLETSPINAIVLDLNLPDISGLDVLKFIKSNAAYTKIAVIIMTAEKAESSNKEALAAGAKCYITKPFDPQILSKKVKELLNQELKQELKQESIGETAKTD
jgi:two-component system, chemotaxis family, chemotaxis protein CheY